jgi:prepilin-type N-terminal cleavage/methylation domain-containing protein
MAKMVSPISSTPRTDPDRQQAFTLTEVMISSVISSIILAAVLSTFLMIGRTSANASNYSDLEVQARTALEMFSREVRLANSVGSGYSATSVTLGIPDSSSSRTAVAYSVTYAFDSAHNTFTRTGPPINNPTGASATTVLVSGVQQIPNVNPFNYYHYVTTGYANMQNPAPIASNAIEIKQIEINFVATRQNVTVTAASNKVLSARFILRNK